MPFRVPRRFQWNAAGSECLVQPIPCDPGPGEDMEKNQPCRRHGCNPNLHIPALKRRAIFVVPLRGGMTGIPLKTSRNRHGTPRPGRDNPILARRFNAGKSGFRFRVPKGRLNLSPKGIARHIPHDVSSTTPQTPSGNSISDDASPGRRCIL